jgi:hypothetical protein
MRQLKTSDRRLSSSKRSGERIETKGADLTGPLGLDMHPSGATRPALLIIPTVKFTHMPTSTLGDIVHVPTTQRPFQENKPPKYKLSSEEKASGLEGFKFWNYQRSTLKSHSTLCVGANVHLEDIVLRVADKLSSREVLERFRVTNNLPGDRSPSPGQPHNSITPVSRLVTRQQGCCGYPSTAT